jgi:hypothetical protein
MNPFRGNAARPLSSRSRRKGGRETVIPRVMESLPAIALLCRIVP